MTEPIRKEQFDALDATYAQICASWAAENISTREALEARLEEYRVYFAYHSGVIENPRISFHDTREVFERGTVTAYTGDVRTLFEIQNQQACHEFLLDAFAVRRAIDLPFVLETHRVLTQGTYDERRWQQGERPGTFKMHDYVVGVAEQGLPADRVEAAMAEMLDQLQLATPDNILTVAAFFHGTLEAIHPFADGNGRVGRALMNYLLMCNGHPPIIVRNDDKMAYYGALEAWDAEADLEPLKTFLKAETIKTWSRLQ